MIPTPPLPGKLKPPPALMTVYAVVALLAIGGLITAAKSGTRPPKDAKAKTAKVAAPRPLSGVTVVLDPGHGGIDSGSISGGAREDSLNYRLTATIAASLRKAGANVVYTVRSKALDVPVVEGKNEPPLIVPSDARLVADGTTILGNKKSLGARAAVTWPYWASLPADKKSAGRGLYFLAVHHDENADVRGGRVEFDLRGGEPPLLAQVLTRRMGGFTFDKKLASWCRHRPDPRRLYVLKPQNNPVPQRALLEAATISHPLDRDLANSRQFRWKIANMVRDSLIECETTLKNAPLRPVLLTATKPAPPVAYPDRSLIAARNGARAKTK